MVRRYLAGWAGVGLEVRSEADAVISGSLVQVKLDGSSHQRAAAAAAEVAAVGGEAQW